MQKGGSHRTGNRNWKSSLRSSILPTLGLKGFLGAPALPRTSAPFCVANLCLLTAAISALGAAAAAHSSIWLQLLYSSNQIIQ